MVSYQIVRFHFKGTSEPGQVFKTLKEAQQWCKREDTHGDGWFDGYREVDDNYVSDGTKLEPSMTKALTSVYLPHRIGS
jgi:hypothetical protein